MSVVVCFLKNIAFWWVIALAIITITHEQEWVIAGHSSIWDDHEEVKSVMAHQVLWSEGTRPDVILMTLLLDAYPVPLHNMLVAVIQGKYCHNVIPPQSLRSTGIVVLNPQLHQRCAAVTGTLLSEDVWFVSLIMSYFDRQRHPSDCVPHWLQTMEGPTSDNGL